MKIFMGSVICCLVLSLYCYAGYLGEGRALRSTQPTTGKETIQATVSQAERYGQKRDENGVGGGAVCCGALLWSDGSCGSRKRELSPNRTEPKQEHSTLQDKYKGRQGPPISTRSTEQVLWPRTSPPQLAAPKVSGAQEAKNRVNDESPI